MFARIALIIALLFPVVAAASDGGLNVADTVIFEHVPGSHVVTVTDASGDSYTVANAMRTEVDGRPILLAQADTGSGSSTATPSPTTPADKLTDPTSNPAKAIDDLKQAERQGWPLLVFMIGAMLAKALGRFKSKPWLAWMDKGRTAIVVGAVGAMLTAGYNAIADGGSLYAAVYAGVVAAAAYWNPLKAG